MPDDDKNLLMAQVRQVHLDATATNFTVKFLAVCAR